ncbi:GLPGLI family protein [Flavobacterium sp. CBA20B-1]|uniref:GLPGLI family protein n=1 Tax=unclassified Flavobacterium TaxID=196869 RepID=UPI002224340C|nr:MULTISPECIES: GLPGLI family protein [unclassified Flavobacterium]WCM41731.1 GLPGLI family protein [Flavobacterium sp. CBA20B-1]
MKKIINIFLILFSLNYSAAAQTTTFKNKVTYKQTLNLGNGNWDVSYDLYFNKDISLYQQVYGKKDREVTHLEDGTISITEFATEKTANYYFSYLNSTKILFGEQIAYDYYHFEEDVPEIKWKLINETKKIGGFTCKKATGKFRGRNYTAWYTEEIPVNAGPWKLKGLTGLILEVADDKGVYKAQAINISLGKDIDLSKKVSKIVFQNKRLEIDQYTKKKKSEQSERLNYINSKLQPGEPLYRMEDQTKPVFIELF